MPSSTPASARAHDNSLPKRVETRVTGVNGKRERVILSSRGRLAFPDSDLAVQSAWAALGGDEARPLAILNAWRRSRRSDYEVTLYVRTVLPKALLAAHDQSVRRSVQRFDEQLVSPRPGTTSYILNRSHDRVLIGITAALNTARYQTGSATFFGAQPAAEVILLYNRQKQPMLGDVVGRSAERAFRFQFVPPDGWAHDIMGSGMAVIDGCFIYCRHSPATWRTKAPEVDAFRQYDDVVATVRLERARIEGSRLLWLTERGYDLPIPVPHDTNCDDETHEGTKNTGLQLASTPNCAWTVTGDAYAAR